MKANAIILAVIFTSCYGINSQTSEIGSMSPSCLDSLAWQKICQQYSVDSIKDPTLLAALEEVKDNFIKPEYILYFKDEPEEIIGCDWYSIRVVYNKKIAVHSLTGLSPLLGNDEQKRIRDRVLREIMKYQCREGQLETMKEIDSQVPYAEEHKDYPLDPTPELMAPEKENN